MKKLLFLFIMWFAVTGLKSQGIAGDWAGHLSVSGVKLKIVFHILDKENKLTSTFDSPDQNALGLKIDETSLDGKELVMNAKSMGITFKGTFDQAGDSISGLWLQGGANLPLVLKRAGGDVVRKPVNPYETEVIFQTASGELKGTLTLPAPAYHGPLVFIIAGSGPTDRDGNSPPALKNSSNCYKILAEDLRTNGIASLRYDKRGIAASASAATKESGLRFENYISDAKEWIVLLSQDKRFTKIIVAGHSEGSLIGMIAARQAKAGGYISVAGTGRPADEILKEQFAGLPQEDKEQVFSMLDKLKKGETLENVPDDWQSFFRPSVQPYLISWFKYDPREEIGKLVMPVLILQGDMDIQVPVDDATLLAKANPNVELKIIRRMNHVLKDTDLKDKAEQVAKVYINPDLPIDKTFTDAMVEFIRKVK